MQLEKGKKLIYIIDGKEYDPVKMGDDGDWYEDADKTATCGDCAAAMGEYHTHGCDIERCPVCGMQFLSCDCGENCEIYEVSEQTEM